MNLWMNTKDKDSKSEQSLVYDNTNTQDQEEKIWC